MDALSPEGPARDAWLRIRALVADPGVVAAEHAFMREVGLSGGPVRALRTLTSAGPQSMRDLADLLGCDKSYVSGLVKPLVAGGFATLQPNPADGRVKVITLTELGRRTGERAERVHETPPASITELSPEHARQLCALLSQGR